MAKEKKVEVKKRNSGLDWLLWWQIDADELKKQVSEYKTLKIMQSARGISTLLLLFSAAVTTLFVLFLNLNASAFLDVVLFIVLAFFTYKGYKWAFIAAMVLWTYEKLYIVIAGLDGVTSPNIIVSLIWWAVYMHAFYLAYHVEKARSSKAKK